MLAEAQSNTAHAGDLIYVHDPMCSWCWAFRPQWEQLLRALPDGLGTVRILGGLAPDSDVPMPEPMRRHLQEVWRTIADTVPGTRFNHDFWRRCEPRRSTYPACRAVIAARNQGDQWDEAMTLGIQTAYYLDARNPSEDHVLIEIAGSIGLDADRFAMDLNAGQTHEALLGEIALSRSLGVSGFPTLMLARSGQVARLPLDYNDSSATLKAIRSGLEALQAGRFANSNSPNDE
ncbi:MAG: DsbA family protein [Gammaproteobacteria bacterium]|nr:DsbA family protein [Gammaproteobacteria bacterium]MYD76970.1 DsbA family protein [Gammaproteobacteria bacterium]MYJ51755.1 DsbA family protein [Gammaproteobacteria bacterium]